MTRIMGMVRALCCSIGRCRRCRLLSTDDGIGGQCIDCGRIHGWMTRDDLRGLAP